MKKLFETLMNAQNGQFITIKTRTDVKLNKRGNPLKDAKVEKISTRNCQWGVSYANSVNNRLEKNGEERTFVAESLPWGEWKVANKVIEHKGAIYYRFYVVKNAKVESTYYVDGKEATPEQMFIINQFMPKTYEASNGVDVMPYNVNEKNILSVKANNMYWAKEDVSLELAA